MTSPSAQLRILIISRIATDLADIATWEMVRHLLGKPSLEARMLGFRVAQALVIDSKHFGELEELVGEAIETNDPDLVWQAMIAFAQVLDYDPEQAWQFVSHAGLHESEEVRSAVATVLLEHLFEKDYKYYDIAREAASLSPRFADTLSRAAVPVSGEYHARHRE